MLSRDALWVTFAILANGAPAPWHPIAPAIASYARDGSGFPNSDDPYTGDAPLPIFGERCAYLEVIRGARLSQYGQVVVEPYHPPIGCDSWEQVVLQMNGRVRGEQFDRFGAVWLSGVELLRTTTPEPTKKGISWQISRDITDSLPVLKSSGNVTLQIPNVVDSTYTGVLEVNVSMHFYSGTRSSKTATQKANPQHRAFVRPLRSVSPLFLDHFAVVGEETQVNMLSGLPRNMVRASLQVFASGHGCEEFWYTNPPDADTPSGGCGGGAYREIEVYVDGLIAGVAYPFPVIYTGGVNPLLWRPLSGIASFDVPPYKFDLSPFVGQLNDGRAHNISLAVRGGSRNGTWFLDGVLYADIHSSVDKLSGAVLSHSDTKPPLEFKKTNSSGKVMYLMHGTRKVQVVGSLNDLTVGVTTLSVTQRLEARSNNTLVGEPLQITTGWMRSESTSEERVAHEARPPQSLISHAWFPYYVWNNSTQNNESFEIDANVNYSRKISLTVTGEGREPFELKVDSGINASALYNRSLTNHSDVHKEQGQSEEASEVQVGSGSASSPCFTWQLSARDGHTTRSKRSHNACKLKEVSSDFYVCGLAICARVHTGGTPRQRAQRMIGPPTPTTPRHLEDSHGGDGGLSPQASAHNGDAPFGGTPFRVFYA